MRRKSTCRRFNEIDSVHSDCIVHLQVVKTTIGRLKPHKNNDDSCFYQRIITGSLTAVVVLKHETSTFRQSHNFVSIDFTFGNLGLFYHKTPLEWVGTGNYEPK